MKSSVYTFEAFEVVFSGLSFLVDASFEAETEGGSVVDCALYDDPHVDIILPDGGTLCLEHVPTEILDLISEEGYELVADELYHGKEEEELI